MKDTITTKLLALYSYLTLFAGAAGVDTELRAGSGLVTRAHNAGTVISVVVIGVVALVGILIFSQVSDAIPQDGPLNNTSQSVIDGFGNAMEFVPIILLVLLASVVIAVVQRMRM